MSNDSIGFFDSGTGGLSILLSVSGLLPYESTLYIGDHANSPYGNKSTEFIRKRGVQLIRFLVSKKCKLVVVACNTATVAGIDYFREQFPDIPIVGVVPVVKTAVSVSKTKYIVVLSTIFTAQSDYQKNLIARFAKNCTIFNIGSSTLVPLIESGDAQGDEVKTELQQIFSPLSSRPFDVIALGCTHFPFITSAVRSIVGNNIQIIDSADAVARQVERILQARNELGNSIKNEVYVTTGDEKKTALIFTQLLKKKIQVSHESI